MRRSFALVVFPLAVALAIPLLLLGGGGAETTQPPWGIGASPLAALRADGARLGLVPVSVHVLEAGAPSATGDAVLLEGRRAPSGDCVFVVQGTTVGPLHCLADVFRKSPLFVVTYRTRGVLGAGSPMTWALGVLRPDARYGVTGEGRERMSLPILAGGAFNLGVPGRSVRLQLFDKGNRLLADVTLHA